MYGAGGTAPTDVNPSVIDFGDPDPGMGFQDWLGLSSTVGGIGGQIASYFMRPKQKRPIRPTRGIGGNPMRRPF
jgi:hypothetical protein